MVRRNKMLWQQKRTQLSILKIDFAIENKTQTQQAKHSVTGTFCFNLDLSEHRRGEIVFVSVR